MPIAIRTYIDTDESAVVSLWQRCGLTRPWNNPGKDIRRKLAEQPELFGVMADDSEVIGTVMAGYEGHRGWINYLAVDPDRRQQGLGRQLMEWAEARLRERGCPKINLQVRQGNEAVLAFYSALGYADDRVVSLGKRFEHDDR
ncbi:GNAT family acetyltransferase [Ideonella sp. DXS29W]|uniref:GNAT family acetyltransferase n=1 Tax=Ideonella lacteola TaxID=2984193 RepID=A0ABU9BN37_9BURK